MRVVFALIFGILFFRVQAQDTRDTSKGTNPVKPKITPISAAEKKHLKTVAFAYQNKAFELDESKHDYGAAIKETDSAFNTWLYLKDTLNMANMQKYKGYLLGNLKEFENAKKEIFSAIQLFEDKKYTSGIAVSYFDMSRVYDVENGIDSSIFYAQKAVDFWKTKKDTLRLVVLSNQMIHLYTEKADFDQALEYQKQSASFIREKTLHHHAVLDFYFLSGKLYEKLKNYKRSLYYNNLYLNKITALKKTGVTDRSGFDQVWETN
jgi:tetratricopeptide (TPR) repeat protein